VNLTVVQNQDLHLVAAAWKDSLLDNADPMSHAEYPLLPDP
jgi:hypothetical protein